MAAAALLAWGRPAWIGLAASALLLVALAAALDRALRARLAPLVLVLGGLALALVAAEAGLSP